MNGIELLASWLTPAVLFCLLNLMIGAIFVISGLKPRRTDPPKASENDAAVSPPQLARVPSFLERVNSIKLSFSRGTVHHEDGPNRDNYQAREIPESNSTNDFHVTRSKSDAGAKASSSASMKKSASDKMQQATDQKEQGKISEVGGAGDEAVDARADDFINRFRQQLKMQRLNSLLNRRSGANTN